MHTTAIAAHQKSKRGALSYNKQTNLNKIKNLDHSVVLQPSPCTLYVDPPYAHHCYSSTPKIKEIQNFGFLEQNPEFWIHSAVLQPSPCTLYNVDAPYAHHCYSSAPKIKEGSPLLCLSIYFSHIYSECRVT